MKSPGTHSLTDFAPAHSAGTGALASLAARLLGVSRRMAAALPLPLSTRGHCCICGAAFAAFLPYAPRFRIFRVPPLMQALGVVGSDVRRFGCPRCLSHDRERHLLLYLRALGMETEIPQWRVLHIAPERHLSRWIAALRPAAYVRGDLFPSEQGIERVDLQALGFPDGSFDLVIANHVLEHVEDDARALREIARVLAPGGRAILQTPYSPVLATTFADAGVTSPQSRLQAYGQEDHVRLYGRDVFQRFAAQGLVDARVTHAQALPGVDSFRHGVNAAEPLFLFRKPGSANAA
jgi:SAM-dependent methyltransferase